MSRYRVEYYRDVVVPLHERIVALTLEQYNFMLVGAGELLAAKRGELDARRGYVESLRDYWLARTDLERAVGGQWPAMEESAAPDAASPTAAPMSKTRVPTHDHHGAQQPCSLAEISLLPRRSPGPERMSPGVQCDNRTLQQRRTGRRGSPTWPRLIRR
ncbi:MAG TPA: hypothetical protein VM487_13115 [Phycisphaerae bacterium]|nr:hypothetical protein [Phycisphaerae bacterium]